MSATMNLAAYTAQVALLVAICAGLPRLLKCWSPVLQFAFWRLLLIVCLCLPFAEPWRLSGPGTATLTRVVRSSVAGAAGLQAIPAPAVSWRLDWVITIWVVLLAGTSARLLWMAIGIGRLRRVEARAVMDCSEEFADLQRLVGVRTAIGWTSEFEHPATFGLFYPVVLLPNALRRADAGAIRAVVAHELFHVRRHDWGWLLGEELIRAAFWFNPAMWWLISRVQLSRETLVDELSILLTNARRIYLETLLALANDAGTSSAAFSARRHLFYRVMLLSKEAGMSSIRVPLASFVLVAALGAGAWSAVQAFPLYSQAPPRDPLVVRQAPQGSSAQPTELVVQQGPQGSPAQSPEAAAFQALVEQLQPIRVGGTIKAPANIKHVNPVFPEDALQARVQGVVILEVVVGGEGKVAGARILRSIPMFDQAALAAVKQWEFTPTLVNGLPQAVLMTVTVNFSLK